MRARPMEVADRLTEALWGSRGERTTDADRIRSVVLEGERQVILELPWHVRGGRQPIVVRGFEGDALDYHCSLPPSQREVAMKGRRRVRWTDVVMALESGHAEALLLPPQRRKGGKAHA